MIKIKKWFDILTALKYRNHDIQRSDDQDFQFYCNAQKPFNPAIEHFTFPYCIHRTVLWDEQEPLSTLPMIKTVIKHTKDYQHVMWNTRAVEQLILSLYDHSHFYFKYSRKIMQADLARYLILYQHGGTYFDLDIRMYSSLSPFIQKIYQERPIAMETHGFCILFEEYRWKDNQQAVNEKNQPIRRFLESKYHTEALVRVANYAFIATPKHPFIKKVIETCGKRAHLIPENDYDVLFITGPDVISHVYHTSKKDFLQRHNVFLLPKEDHNTYIKHLSNGQWREDG